MKSALARGLWWSLGRRNLVRLGRFLSNEGRLDVNNDMSANGERLVQRAVLAHYPLTEPLHVVDVGGNVGDWSAALAASALEVGTRPLDLHVFEPAPAAFAALQRRLADLPEGFCLELIAGAASSREGEGLLHLVGEALGVNSLHPREDSAAAPTVPVALTTLDLFCAQRGIQRVGLVKCDTEGHDAEVIAGARGLLGEGRIDVLQFEYNWRWVDARRYLRDVFEEAGSVGYRVGKVTPLGIEFYRSWHPELETFREGNYLLCHERSVPWFPTLVWWNELA